MVPITYAETSLVPLTSKRRRSSNPGQQPACHGHVRPPLGVPIIEMTRLLLKLDLCTLDFSSILKPNKRARTLLPAQEGRSVCSERSSPRSVPVQVHNQSRKRRFGRQLKDGDINGAGRCPSTREIEMPETVALVDAAFRSLIVRGPKRTTETVKVSRENADTTLADIAPGLWSPGYLPVREPSFVERAASKQPFDRQAMSQRAPLLSTLANAIVSVGRRATSSSLKDRYRELSQSPFPSVLDAGQSSSSSEGEVEAPQALEESDVAAIIQARLWRQMQKGLHNPAAARSLHPLKVALEDGEGVAFPDGAGDSPISLLGAESDDPCSVLGQEEWCQSDFPAIDWAFEGDDD